MLCFKAVLRTLEAKASSCPVTKKLLFVLLPSVWRSEMRGGPVTMGSYTTSSEILDETHCCWVMCPHPCCWEAEQRVARGIARRIQSRVPGRNGVLIEEECPTLKIVNVGSEWVKTRKPSKKKLPHRAFSSESSHSFTSQSPLPRHSINLLRDSGITLESVRDLHFPELKSAAKSPYSTNNKHSREVKLSKAKISPLESSCGILCDSVSMVIWMPNPKHVPHSPTHHRWKSPHFAVKDLTCIPSSQMCKTAKLLAHTKMVSPSGSLPGHTISQIGLHTTEPSPTDTRVELTIGKNQETMQPEREPEPHVVPRPATAAGEASACLRSKPAVFCRVRERGAQRVAFQSAPTHHAHYRLDSKNCSEGIDWLRLRSQTYLWKRQKLRQHWDKDSPTLPLHRLPQHHTQPDSKATLLCHHRSALAIGPAVYDCVECVGGVSSCEAGGVMGTKTWCSDTSTEGFHKLSLCSDQRQPVDAGDISERKLNDKNTNSPSNSVLHLMDYAGQDSLELEVGTDIKHVSESGGWGSGRILTQDTVERDSGNDSVSEDRDCGYSRSQPPVPPPSLRSDTSRWTVTAGKGHQPPVQVTTL